RALGVRPGPRLARLLLRDSLRRQGERAGHALLAPERRPLRLRRRDHRRL
ncbi:MAG: hypothetical protein AVDCRST_MAG22-3051, partial [uncultured Rubrobacteraceae bacterium]